MFFRRKAMLAVAALTSLSMVLVGCGGSEQGSKAENNTLVVYNCNTDGTDCQGVPRADGNSGAARCWRLRRAHGTCACGKGESARRYHVGRLGRCLCGIGAISAAL